MTNGKVVADLLLPYLIYNHVIGKQPTPDTYDNRLLWQKVGYLSQQMGLPLDEFHFNWYLAGPYSSNYTDVLYSIKNNVGIVSNQAKHYALNKVVKSKLSVLKDMGENCPSGMSISKWFELLASILYLAKINGRTKEQTIKRLVRSKPFFNDQKVNDYAWGLLQKNNLL